jgi:N-carbamoyl-L-amino-acid hydrolase
LSPLDTARRLFKELANETADLPGVTRASYGAGETLAHRLIEREAARIGLEARTDPVGNLYVTLRGRNRDAPVLMTGSHLDSVPHGGNFDGAAGVLAGLALLEHLASQPAPPCDVVLMVIRAEEMIWFPEHYLGSRAAFGLLPRDTPERVRRGDTGRSLSDHMLEAGFDPEPIRDGIPLLDPTGLCAFVELHIEQGPVLVEHDVPVGIVTAIRGNIRYRHAAIRGQTTHAGGVPRRLRRDAVLAGVELAAALEQEWLRLEGDGHDLVLTIGQFATDPVMHGITKVPGRLDFTLDFRSADFSTLLLFDDFLHKTANQVSTRRSVSIELGHSTQAKEAAMEPGIRAGLAAAAAENSIPALELPSGGGHDCAVFAGQGVPSAMIFVRNENGSHNPDETMEFGDFAAAWDILRTWAENFLSEL